MSPGHTLFGAVAQLSIRMFVRSVRSVPPGLPIHLSRPPFSGRLLLWGQAADGWWGLVAWSQRVVEAGEQATLPFAAWVPGSALSKPGWSSAAEPIPRVTLTTDRADWPGPASWPGWYAGVWTDGAPARPPGVELANQPRWRK